MTTGERSTSDLASWRRWLADAAEPLVAAAGAPDGGRPRRAVAWSETLPGGDEVPTVGLEVDRGEGVLVVRVSEGMNAANVAAEAARRLTESGSPSVSVAAEPPDPAAVAAEAEWLVLTVSVGETEPTQELSIAMSRPLSSSLANRRSRRERRRLRPQGAVRDNRIVLTASLTPDEHDLVRKAARAAGWGSSSVPDVREVAFHLPGRKVVAMILSDSLERTHAHHSQTTLATLKRIRHIAEQRDVPALFLLRWHDRDYVNRLLDLGVRDVFALPANDDDLVARLEDFFQTLSPMTDRAA